MPLVSLPLIALAVGQVLFAFSMITNEEENVTWKGLCSRDSQTREQAMQNITEEVQTKVNVAVPAMEEAPCPDPSDLSPVLARILMLSKRCPFPDVRQKSLEVLNQVQVQ